MNVTYSHQRQAPHPHWGVSFCFIHNECLKDSNIVYSFIILESSYI